MNTKNVTAIILAAGNSTRYGSSNKNFELIDDKEVIIYSIEAFDKNPLIDNIIVTIKEEEEDKLREILNKYEFNKKINIVYGGATRKESVYNSIRATNSDIVIIHDGARPLIKDYYINECINNMDKYDGCIVGELSRDTVKIVDENNIVVNTTDRSKTWLIKTPQCFNRDVLLRSHINHKNSEVTDDASLLELDNIPVKVIKGDSDNIKITYGEDLELVKKYVKRYKHEL
jgi:2-C-methyl-D-erythritol 4-phosphate cytidylyltransferase